MVIDARLRARVSEAIDTLNERIGRGVAWLTAGMVAVMFAVVLLRYGFELGRIWLQEVVVYMHALVFLLGMGYTLRHDEHVRVDVFYRRMSERGRAWVDLSGTLLLLLPTALFIIYSSWDYVASSWSQMEGSHETGGLPFVYLLKTAIPVSAALIGLQGIARILKCVDTLRGTQREGG